MVWNEAPSRFIGFPKERRELCSGRGTSKWCNPRKYQQSGKLLPNHHHHHRYFSILSTTSSTSLCQWALIVPSLPSAHQLIPLTTQFYVCPKKEKSYFLGLTCSLLPPFCLYQALSVPLNAFCHLTRSFLPVRSRLLKERRGEQKEDEAEKRMETCEGLIEVGGDGKEKREGRARWDQRKRDSGEFPN